MKKIAHQIASQGGRAFFAGGWVRDTLLCISEVCSDVDVEVFNIPREQLLSILKEYGPINLNGPDFRIIKVKGLPEYDFVIPEPINVDFSAACRRRDFTINAILMDIISGEIIDPLMGRKDLEDKFIRISAPGIFLEDPLRAYQAAVLAACLNFTIEPATFELMKKCSLKEVSKERIFAELTKLLIRADRPSQGLIYLERSGILAELHPGLQNLVGCPQPPDHHPEGDAWQHTLCVVDRAADMKKSSKDPEVFMLSALLHDIGKPRVTQFQKDRITSYGHDTAGGELAMNFLKEMRCPARKAIRIAGLVREHMRPVLLYKTRGEVSDQAIRRLAGRVDTQELLLLSEADYLGRKIKRDYEPIKQWLMGRLKGVGLKFEGVH